LNKMLKKVKSKNFLLILIKKHNLQHKKIKKPKKKKNNLIKPPLSLLKIKPKLMSSSNKLNPHS
jgi:hypothetical protein